MNVRIVVTVSAMFATLGLTSIESAAKEMSSGAILECLPDTIDEFTVSADPFFTDHKDSLLVLKYYKSEAGPLISFQVSGWSRVTPNVDSQDKPTGPIDIGGKKATVSVTNEQEVTLSLFVSSQMALNVRLNKSLDASIPMRVARKLDMACLANLQYPSRAEITNNNYVTEFMPNSSMEPTITYKKEIQVDPDAYRTDVIKRFDIVAVEDPNKPGTVYIKRIVGMGGEVITIKYGVVYINDRVLDEPYDRKVKNETFGPFTIPVGEFFVIGDDRRGSWDSRLWEIKTVKSSQIKGRLVAQ